MSDVFYLRRMDPAVTEDDVQAMAVDAGGCLDMHRVQWEQSFLAHDGERMLCWYRAPDAESARIALQQLGSDMNTVWAGTVHDAPGPDAPTLADANVLVERSWDEPVTMEEIQAIEDAGAWCLETHKVKFVRTFFSTDRTRMVCLYQAPDAESVRLAQRQAEMPVDLAWAFRPIRP
jgi:hypothetical protein